MELKDLAGFHMLTGVDFEIKVDLDDNPANFTDPANGIRFQLDGVTYCAIEDKSDGYRSCMKEIRVVDTPMKNQFPDVMVTACHRTDYVVTADLDILDIVDVLTGRLIVQVGTRDCGDYYPSWVGYFDPKAMSFDEKVQMKLGKRPKPTPPKPSRKFRM